MNWLKRYRREIILALVAALFIAPVFEYVIKPTISAVSFYSVYALTFGFQFASTAIYKDIASGNETTALNLSSSYILILMILILSAMIMISMQSNILELKNKIARAARRKTKDNTKIKEKCFCIIILSFYADCWVFLDVCNVL